MDKIQYKMKSVVGPLYLVASKDGLQGIYFNKQRVRSVKKLGSKEEESILSKTTGQLKEYFAGRRKRFNVSFDLSGTSFQKQVWRELFKIPFGGTVSYKDIAQRVRNPRAVRAVGSAIGRNPVGIIIPCHRVITSSGSIGGYAGGVEKKRRLLKLETAFLV